MVIDFHTHYARWGGPRLPEDTPQRTLQLLATSGVEGALISPLVGLFSSCTDHVSENDELYSYCREVPGRLFAAFSVNPLMGQPALDEIRRCNHEHDARVLKLHPWLQGFSVSSPEMDKIAELCEELGISILFHDGTPVYTHPLQIARLCRDFPNLTVVAGHAGLGDLAREAMLAAERYPNFVLCLCGPRELDIGKIIKSIRPEQLCVGSDIFTSDYGEAVLWFRWRSFRAVEMPEQVRRTIEQDTPARLVGLYDGG